MSEARIAQLERIAAEAAAMAVRREVRRVGTAAQRYAGNQEAWMAWLAHFYAAEHPRVLRERLHLTASAADAYCRRHHDDALHRGPRVLGEWERCASAELLALAAPD